eukprot:1141432-Pelagomonas_calceolata.AAC.6
MALHLASRSALVARALPHLPNRVAVGARLPGGWPPVSGLCLPTTERTYSQTSRASVCQQASTQTMPARHSFHAFHPGAPLRRAPAFNALHRRPLALVVRASADDDEEGAKKVKKPKKKIASPVKRAMLAEERRKYNKSRKSACATRIKKVSVSNWLVGQCPHTSTQAFTDRNRDLIRCTCVQARTACVCVNGLSTC